MPVAVVTDTTSYLPPELVEEHGITLVPLYIVFGDRTERESDITDYPAFFEELRSSAKLPTTSQPSIGDFIAAYGPLLDRGDDIVSVHISAGISGTSDAARQAAEQLERDGRGGERIRVIDSTTTAGGLGICALAGACAARGRHDRRARSRQRIRDDARGDEDLVRDRHARVPQARRADRRGERLDRIDAARQADPHRSRASWSRSSASAPARGCSSGWSTTPSSATTRAPTPGSSSTSPRPRRREADRGAAARCSGASRCSSARSGRC